jgi:hypothetical protein
MGRPRRRWLSGIRRRRGGRGRNCEEQIRYFSFIGPYTMETMLGNEDRQVLI